MVGRELVVGVRGVLGRRFDWMIGCVFHDLLLEKLEMFIVTLRCCA